MKIDVLHSEYGIGRTKEFSPTFYVYFCKPAVTGFKPTCDQFTEKTIIKGCCSQVVAPIVVVYPCHAKIS